MVLVVILGLSGCTTSSLPRAHATPTARSTALAPLPSAPPLVAALTSWQLPAPVSRAVVLAYRHDLLVAGGLDVNGQSASGVFRLRLADGVSSLLGTLPYPVHDAAGAMLRGRVLVFGGGAVSSTAAVQSLAPGADGQVTGQLPAPRSDLTSAVSGNTAYVLGGYDGVNMATTVLETTDGVQFRVAARLAVPVRYAAAVTFGARLFVFGGRRTNADTAAIQEVDLRARSIVVNEENNEVVVRLAFPSGRLEWSYGHPGIAGSSSGYLHEPDDAYLLKNGQVVVADAQNCRVVLLSSSGTVVQQIGTTGVCVHQPPAALGLPNGDTPLPDGNLLISEINGSWVSEYSLQGRLVWTVQLPIAYPSDPQQIGPDRYLVADYTSPGGLYEFSRSGRIVWSYSVSSGPWMLDHPSLAERLPNGLLAVTDDYRHRIVVINPVTHSVVWQYGQTDAAGTARGFLNTPDGFDLLAPNGHTPTHSATR